MEDYYVITTEGDEDDVFQARNQGKADDEQQYDLHFNEERNGFHEKMIGADDEGGIRFTSLDNVVESNVKYQQNYADGADGGTQFDNWAFQTESQQQEQYQQRPAAPSLYKKTTSQQKTQQNKPTVPINASASAGESEWQVTKYERPKFTHSLQAQLVIMEGKPFSLTTKVGPVTDPSLAVEWYRNGVPICAGSRINTKFDRGFAVLEVRYSIAQDVGTYFCVARSNSGLDQSNSCYVEVLQESGVDQATQLPDAEMINSISKMEDHMAYTDARRRYQPDDNDDPSGGRPARFLKPLGPQANIQVRENKPIHLETVVAPANDPSLTVEWYRNGVSIPMSCRYKSELDRGFAIFDIHSATTDDSGQYFCIAKNRNGAAQSNIISIKCLEDPSIVTQSALPQESVDYLSTIDTPMDFGRRYDNMRYKEVQEIESAPIFVVMPENQVVQEKSPAKFLVKTKGVPTPRIVWFMNGNLLNSTSNCRIYNDGAINYLEFHRCEDLGTNRIQALARNNLGEAVAEAQLRVVPSADFRPELRHVMPEITMRRTQDLETAGRLNNRVHLRRVDRAFSTQPALSGFPQPNDAEQAENLYHNVHNRLRRPERITNTTAPLEQKILQQPVAQTSQQRMPQTVVAQSQQPEAKNVVSTQMHRVSISTQPQHAKHQQHSITQMSQQQQRLPQQQQVFHVQQLPAQQHTYYQQPAARYDQIGYQQPAQTQFYQNVQQIQLQGQPQQAINLGTMQHTFTLPPSAQTLEMGSASGLPYNAQGYSQPGGYSAPGAYYPAATQMNVINYGPGTYQNF